MEWLIASKLPIRAPCGVVADRSYIESTTVPAMYLGNLAKVARTLETVDHKTIGHVERSRARQDAELALDFAPSELVVKGKPFRKQQRDFETFAHHRLDR